MRLLEERIRKDGQALNESVLKVGSFLNIQVDPDLMEALGKDFADHFADFGINKVVTIESSGIAPALMAAKYLKVPLVIMKKSTSKILDGEVLQTRVMSYTKGIEYGLTIHENYIHPGENILLIDDFIANGEAAKGAVHLIEEAGATVAGIGIVIEKSFQAGRKQLEKAGYKVYSQARIARLSKGVIEYMELE